MLGIKIITDKKTAKKKQKNSIYLSIFTILVGMVKHNK